jgi:hypothetical protein
MAADWNIDTDANHFDQSYVKGFVDLSGSVVIRNDNKLITNADLSLGGNLTINPTPPIVTNHLISSAYLVEQGYGTSTPSIGIIPSEYYGSGLATWTYPLELTNVLVTSLDQITVTGANKDGDFGWGQTWQVVYKYETDHLGNAVEGHWIFGSGHSSASSAAVIAFTLIGTTPSVVWKRMNATNGLTSVNGDGNYTTSAADLARVINELELTSTYSLTSQAWKQVSNYYGVNELAFTTSAVQPPGTTSFSNESMTLKSHLFIGNDISANSNVYVGGDLSVNGQFSGNFANGIIPSSAIGGGGGGGGAIEISGNVLFTGDVSFNCPTVDVNNSPLITTALIHQSELVVQGSNYILPATTAIVLSNVSINSLDEIEPTGTASVAASLICGAAINAGGAGEPCVFYKYPVDENGNALVGNWIFAYATATATKSVRIAFTLDGTTPSIRQIGQKHDGGTGTDYTSSAAALISLWNGTVGYYTSNVNSYSLDDFSYTTSVVPLQVNQIEFNDATTMSTYDDNILSGTFADSNVVFKDSTFASVICEGVATATTTQGSDYRIKENVTELNETDTVDALVPIQYNNTVSGNHEFGLLAHELQEVYPDLVVGEKDGDEYQRVHYNGLIGVLVKEIQGVKRRLELK